jgi:hypothetical protein
MDLDKIHIYDNFLPFEVQDELEKKLGYIPFRFAKNNWKDPIKIKVKDSKLTNVNRPGLLQCLSFYDGWDMSTNSKWVEELLNYLPFKYELQRIKFNFNPKVSNHYKNKCMHPHCDMNEGGYTAIYYLNESDGDTVIFNEKTMDPFLKGEELSIKKIIKNKKGRLVMFNQDYLHAGMFPIKSDYRVVINLNFKIL